MQDQLQRIANKLRARQVTLRPALSEEEVDAFEARHGVVLPADYRAFLITLGNGGVGPPHYGLVPLGAGPSDGPPDERAFWRALPQVREPFPFTQPWVWEADEVSNEGTWEDVRRGSLYLGTEGCGMNWHLVLTGPERGVPWQLTGEGIAPVMPRRSFLQWYEDWLDGRDSFYGCQGNTA